MTFFGVLKNFCQFVLYSDGLFIVDIVENPWESSIPWKYSSDWTNIRCITLRLCKCVTCVKTNQSRIIRASPLQFSDFILGLWTEDYRAFFDFTRCHFPV